MNSAAAGRLTASDLAFRYAHQAEPVFQGLSLDIEPGQFVGLIGPNGTGKSTLLRLLAGLRPPEAGQVSLDGRPLSGFSRPELARRIAFVPQDVRLWLPFTCREVVAMGRFARQKGWGLRESSADAEIIERCLAETQTDHLAGRRITDISGGEAQRVRIAQALAQQTDILILDEPTAHLDIRHQVGLMELAVRLSRRGLTVIAALHDLDMTAMYCSRIAILSQGRLAGWGAPQEVLTPEAIKDAFGVDAAVRRDERGYTRVALDRSDPPSRKSIIARERE